MEGILVLRAGFELGAYLKYVTNEKTREVPKVPHYSDPLNLWSWVR